MQRFLNALPYNTEPPPGPRAAALVPRRRPRITPRTAWRPRSVAAVILEQHGYPPLVMSLESVDGLDHVIFVYRHRGRWGSVARSRDPGLHGRKPVFRSLRRLAESYFEGFIDKTGCLQAYGVVDLRVLGSYNWRLSTGNVWKVERMLFDIPHRPIRVARARASPGCARGTSRRSRRIPAASRCTTMSALDRLARWISTYSREAVKYVKDFVGKPRTLHVLHCFDVERLVEIEVPLSVS